MWNAQQLAADIEPRAPGNVCKQGLLPAKCILSVVRCNAFSNIMLCLGFLHVKDP